MWEKEPKNSVGFGQFNSLDEAFLMDSACYSKCLRTKFWLLGRVLANQQMWCVRFWDNCFLVYYLKNSSVRAALIIFLRSNKGCGKDQLISIKNLNNQISFQTTVAIGFKSCRLFQIIFSF